MSSSQALISRVLTNLRAIGARVGRTPTEPTCIRLPLVVQDLGTFLGGGLPCGAITEIFGEVSAGRTTLAQILISAAIRAGELAAWIDLPNSFDPSCADTAGIDLERMLWVSPASPVAAVRAAEHVLDTGGFRVVVLDLDVPSSTKTMLPASVWLRMNRAAARRDAAVVVLDAVHTVGAFAALSLEVRAGRRMFVGNCGPCPVFAESTSSLLIRRCRFGLADESPFDLVASTRV